MELYREESYDYDTEWLRDKLLGKGAFGRVYRVESLKTGKFYAGKFSGSETLFKGGLSPISAKKVKEELEKADKLLSTEIKIHSKLSDPNIVQYIDSFRTKSCHEEKEIMIEEDPNGGCLAMIIEMCYYGDLSKMVKMRGKLTEPEAIYIVYQIGKALLYLRKKGVIHRDLKPANILFCGDMIPKLGDFGLAIPAKNKPSRRSGTPRFMAPEIWEGEEYSYPVDVWALGVTLFYLLSGKYPFNGQNKEYIARKVKNISYTTEGHNFSPDVANLFCKVFVKDPKHRIKIDEFLKHPLFTSNPILESLPYESISVEPSSQELTFLPALKPRKKSIIDIAYDKITKTLKKQGTPLVILSPPPSPPEMWIKRYVHDDKRGTFYQYNTGIYGFHYNDRTNIITNGTHFQYITAQGERFHYDMTNYKYPIELESKLKTMNRLAIGLDLDFKFKMNVELTKEYSYVLKLLIAKRSIVFRLSNDILQVDLTDNQLKFIFTNEADILTVIDSHKSTINTYYLSNIGKDSEKHILGGLRNIQSMFAHEIKR